MVRDTVVKLYKHHQTSIEMPKGSFSSIPTAPTPGPVHPLAQPKTDLRKEYNRFCKLYSSEPLDIVAGPLEKASYRQDCNLQLDLKGRGLRGIDCIALGKILTTNLSIYHLNLSDCLLLPQGFQALLEGIGKNGHLGILELRGNNIQGGMVETLGTLLKVNHTLRKLLLEWNCCGNNNSAFKSLCGAIGVNKGLHELDLRNNQIPDESGLDLATALKGNDTLQQLDLRWNSIGVQGAKALLDSVQSNGKLVKLELCGNFVPEELVRHIETTLGQRGEKEKIIKDYSNRTSLLTRQLQKTETEFKHEIESIVTVYEQEETKFKRLIREGHEEIGRLEKEIWLDKKETTKLVSQINNLENNLQLSQDREKVVRRTVEMKEEEISKLEEISKCQIEELKSDWELQLGKVRSELSSCKEQNERLSIELEYSSGTIKAKDGEILILQNRLECQKQAAKRMEDLFEERIKKERESWMNWKAEVETREHLEAKRLASQVQELQQVMKDHVKSLEAKRNEAEEEINRQKILLLTSKTEAEETLSKLRNVLNEELALRCSCEKCKEKLKL